MGNEPTWKEKSATGAEIVIGVISGIAVLWFFLVFAVGLSMAVFIPSAEYPAQVFISLAGTLAVAIAASSMVAYRWVSRVPEVRHTVRGANDETVSPIIADFRVRSGMYRIAAAALFLMLMAVTIGGFYVVSQPALQRAAYHQALPGELPPLLEPLVATEEQREILTDPEVVNLLTAILNRSSYPRWGDTIGPITLWLVLLQITASLFRYMVRLASFYDSRADYLQLAGAEDAKDPRKLLDVVDPSGTIHQGWIRELIGKSEHSQT